MNIAQCERSEWVLSSSGQKDLSSNSAKFFADSLQSERGDRESSNVERMPGRSVDAYGHFNRFAFKAVPLVDPDGLWLSAHLVKRDETFGQAWRIYVESFTDFERRSFLEQRQVMLNPRYRFSAILDRSEVVGVLGCWELSGFCFIEHFAVSSSHRSSGYGRRVIQLLQRQVQGPVLLDVEPFGTDLFAARRVTFYNRLGFNYCGKAVTLPPYVGKVTAPSNLMSWPMPLGREACAQALSTIEREIYGLHSFMPHHHAV